MNWALFSILSINFEIFVYKYYTEDNTQIAVNYDFGCRCNKSLTPRGSPQQFLAGRTHEVITDSGTYREILQGKALNLARLWSKNELDTNWAKMKIMQSLWAPRRKCSGNF